MAEIVRVRSISSAGRLGAALREARRAQRMSQQELSDATGVSRSRISLIESGRANPGTRQVMILLRALNCMLTLICDPDQYELSRYVDGFGAGGRT